MLSVARLWIPIAMLVLATSAGFAQSPIPTFPSGAGYREKKQEEIPLGYSTYALFLVCNAHWLRENEHDGNSLFFRFTAFERTIGSHNKAFWFWKDPSGGTSMSNVDIERAGRYCSGYGLKPTESPHILVTVGYPLERSSGQHHVILSLGGLTAKGTRALIGLLEDQIVLAALRQEEIDSQRYWRKWEAIMTDALGALRGLFPSFDIEKIEVEAKASNFGFKVSGTKR